MPLPRRRHIRLDPALYARLGPRCSVTLCAADRTPVFANPAVGRAAVDVLSAHAGRTNVPVYAYCLMPDHVHPVLFTVRRSEAFETAAEKGKRERRPTRRA